MQLGLIGQVDIVVGRSGPNSLGSLGSFLEL
jgi:hypothetical protein